ncbi:MAG: NAD(P)/FAD-dependent oxidoreductase [Candidatus Omnitrophica bacterium]|nr:NAD(P)/FAD-dependent oxidoreductase [Candidatus Omnitrophota bacterium]
MSDEVRSYDVYDIAVVGGGAAGTMAAIRASALKKRVVLIESNDSIGKKILITGKGRCNLTNTAPIDVFIEKFGRQGKFLRSAFFNFFNEDLIDFFRSKGMEVKAERQGRVFPATDKARSVVEVLARCLKEGKVEQLYNATLLKIKKKDDIFDLEIEGGRLIKAKNVILATGGASYKATGSTGSGFRIAADLGHEITPLKPALVPLKVREEWVKSLQGIALENVRLTFEYDKKRHFTDVGEIIFTHFGASGPLILDNSGDIMAVLGRHKEIRLLIDLKPGLRSSQLEERLLRDFRENGKVSLKSVMKNYLPQRLIAVFLDIAGVNGTKASSQITQKERRALIAVFKAFPLTITGALPLEDAMVTAGGVALRDIDPRTMESRIIPGLYFAGEIIDGAASSGGYNLQQAFSTGYLAGQSAAERQ